MTPILTPLQIPVSKTPTQIHIYPRTNVESYLTIFLGLSGSGSCGEESNPKSGSSDKSPHEMACSPLKLARRRRRLVVPSPQERRNRQLHTANQSPGFIPDSESSPTSSPVAARRLRKLTLFDSPRTPRSIARHSDSPRYRSKLHSPSIRSSGRISRSESPKVDPGITINPFTPANRSSGSKKSRVSIRAAATSRYKSEFIELSRLGQGEFGAVYRVVNR